MHKFFALRYKVHLPTIALCTVTERKHSSLRSYPLISVCAEKSCVMSFLYNNEGNARLVILFQLDTGLPNCQKLMMQYLFYKHKVRGKSEDSDCFNHLTLLFFFYLDIYPV